jgi:hypothetical protein
MWRPSHVVGTALVVLMTFVVPATHATPIDCEQHCENVRRPAKRAKCVRHCKHRCRKTEREACYSGRHGQLSCCARGTECCGEQSCCASDEHCCPIEHGGETTTICCPSNRSCCGTPDGDPYCADLGSDAANCGGCGVACTAGQTCCDTFCVDLTNDPTNCGACGHACGHQERCVDAQCRGSLCAPPKTPCLDREHPTSAVYGCCAPGDVCCNDGACHAPFETGGTRLAKCCPTAPDAGGVRKWGPAPADAVCCEYRDCIFFCPSGTQCVRPEFCMIPQCEPASP